MKRILTFVALCALLGACRSHEPWTRFVAEGIPASEESYNALLFTDSTTGYLGGHRMIKTGEVNGQYQFTDRTVLYTTKDRGQSWSRLPLDYKGSVSRIFPFGDTLLVLLQHVSADSVHILRSPDRGASWQELFSTSRDNYIRELHFTDPRHAHLILDNRQTQYLLSYNHNRWDTVLVLPEDCDRHRIFDHTVMSLITESSTGHSNGVLITDIASGKARKLPFDRSYYVSSLTKSNNGLLLAASRKDSGRVLVVTADSVRVIDLGPHAAYEPREVLASDDTFIAIASRQKDAAFLGVIHHLLLSTDKGRTWSLEELPDPMFIEAPTLAEGGFFMVYCGAGAFQLRPISK